MLGIIIIWASIKISKPIVYRNRFKKITGVNIKDFKGVKSCRASYGNQVDYSGYEYGTYDTEWTWEHTRVDGGPDLRYKVNNKIPLKTAGYVRVYEKDSGGIAIAEFSRYKDAEILRDKLRGMGMTSIDDKIS